MGARFMSRSTTTWVVEPSQRICSGLPACGCAVDGVREAENGAADAGDAGADEELVVVAGGGFVAAGGFDDGDAGLLLALHGFVVEAELAHEFGAADLEPYEVVGVVDDAHLVGFGVANPYFCFSGHGSEFSLWRYGPCRRGRRGFVEAS